jgi:arylsulfatase A-like enzyme
VPLAVWGAGVEAGKRGHLVSNADLAPTILSLAGVPYDPYKFDGSSFAGALDGTLAPNGFHKIQLFERWTTNDPTLSELGPATYSGIRTMAGKTFTRYATGETEYYDLEADPSQAKNLARARPATADALDAKRATLAACSGDSCKTADGSAGPWSGAAFRPGTASRIHPMLCCPYVPRERAQVQAG